MEDSDNASKVNVRDYINPLAAFAAITGLLYLIGFSESAVIAKSFGIVNLSLSEPIQTTIARGFIAIISHYPEILSTAILVAVFLVSFMLIVSRKNLRKRFIRVKSIFITGWSLSMLAWLCVLGAMSGIEKSNLIINEVTAGCETDCRIYKTASRKHLGIAIQGNENFQLIYTRTGVAVLPLEKIVSIHKPGLKPTKIPVIWKALPSFPKE